MTDKELLDAFEAFLDEHANKNVVFRLSGSGELGYSGVRRVNTEEKIVILQSPSARALIESLIAG
jgi:hypothetical protein